MARLCNTHRVFCPQLGGTGRNFASSSLLEHVQSLLCCAARASSKLKFATVAGVKQVLTGPLFQKQLRLQFEFWSMVERLFSPHTEIAHAGRPQ
jgi:hypothetical protein